MYMYIFISMDVVRGSLRRETLWHPTRNEQDVMRDRIVRLFHQAHILKTRGSTPRRATQRHAEARRYKYRQCQRHIATDLRMARDRPDTPPQSLCRPLLRRRPRVFIAAQASARIRTVRAPPTTFTTTPSPPQYQYQYQSQSQFQSATAEGIATATPVCSIIEPAVISVSMDLSARLVTDRTTLTHAYTGSRGGRRFKSACAHSAHSTANSQRRPSGDPSHRPRNQSPGASTPYRSARAVCERYHRYTPVPDSYGMPEPRMA